MSQMLYKISLLSGHGRPQCKWSTLVFVLSGGTEQYVHLFWVYCIFSLNISPEANVSFVGSRERPRHSRLAAAVVVRALCLQDGVELFPSSQPKLVLLQFQPK